MEVELGIDRHLNFLDKASEWFHVMPTPFLQSFLMDI